MRRAPEQRRFRSRFDDLSQIQHRDRLGDMAHDLKVVRNKKIGDAHVLLQVHQQIQHLRLNRNVERGHGLVGNQELRLQHQRARHRNSLALSSREHVGIAALVLGTKTHARHHRPSRVAPGCRGEVGVDRQRLAEQRHDLLTRIERGVRILEHHLHLRPQAFERRAVGMRDILAV